MPAKHRIQPLVARIAEVECEPPALQALEDLLPGSLAEGTRPGLPLQVAPLFTPPPAEMDFDSAEVSQHLEAEAARIAQEMQSANQQELIHLGSKYVASLNELNRAVTSVERVVASEVVDLALVVASELIGAEMRAKPEMITEVVERALASVQHDGQVRVRLCPMDMQVVRAHIDADESLDVGMICLEEDASLSYGDCVVETPKKIVDVSVAARLCAVRESLVRTLMSEEAREEGEIQ